MRPSAWPWPALPKTVYNIAGTGLWNDFIHTEDAVEAIARLHGRVEAQSRVVDEVLDSMYWLRSLQSMIPSLSVSVAHDRDWVARGRPIKATTKRWRATRQAASKPASCRSSNPRC